jgi:hypothetical protein
MRDDASIMRNEKEMRDDVSIMRNEEREESLEALPFFYPACVLVGSTLVVFL